jgi:hypothetical protein
MKFLSGAVVHLPRHHILAASLHVDEIQTMTVDEIHGVPVSTAEGEIRSAGGPVQDAAQRCAGKIHEPRISGLLCEPTLPNAIEPKRPFCIAEMAVRDHIRHTIALQHQTGRDHAWRRRMPSVFIHNRDRALFGDRCRQYLEAWGRLNGTDWGISKREQRREMC